MPIPPCLAYLIWSHKDEHNKKVLLSVVSGQEITKHDEKPRTINALTA